MKVQIKSIFEQIAEKVFVMSNLDNAKAFILEFVEGKDIKESDKKSIIKNVTEAKSLIRLYNYISNSLLKYEGMGMNQINKTAKETASETAFV